MEEFNERDLFAGLAMCGQLANSKIDTQATYDDVARCSYEIADAMLKAREHQDPEEGIAAIPTRKR
jgi:hypothetical protein